MARIPWKIKQKDGAQQENPLVALRTEMDRLFDSFVRDPWAALESRFGMERAWSPAVDVAETEDEVTIRAEVPGVEPANLDISLTGNQLVLSGEKKESAEKKEGGFYQSETRYGSFRRSVTLPETIDPNQVEADYANGVLTIRLKKSVKTPPKRIDVKVK